jgi:HK97 gp10 family phage protein
MIMANSDVTGLDDFLKYLAGAPAQMKTSVGAGIAAGTALIEATAKANCPVHLGELQSSIHAVVTDTVKGVYASVKAGGTAPDGTVINYAHLIEFSGAAPHVIEAHGKELAFNGHTYPEVHHPGMQAHPFLRPALDANELAAVGLVDQAIDSLLKLN